MIGDVWEWTTSDYVPYPGFKSEFDEYNDKWFVNQKVLRGGSFATPQLHIRSTYRNFFHAHERWMTVGVPLREMNCADLSAASTCVDHALTLEFSVKPLWPIQMNK
jgi:hypothetical protein